MASHLASLWKWDFLELGNGLLVKSPKSNESHSFDRGKNIWPYFDFMSKRT